MFQQTHSEAAPWVLISAEQKRHARIAVLRAVLERLRTSMVAQGDTGSASPS